tara:strand:+ start:83 stop:631 length:549 start_codon:yes stop_codon:yes gene_type:complete
MKENQNFNFQPSLSGNTISLRPIHEDDFAATYACASDKRIWAGHPSPLRYQQDEFEKWFSAAMACKTCVVAIDNASGDIIGSSRYYLLDTIADDISIGFSFLACAYWGGDTNFEFKQLMLDHAFEHYDRVWFHISPDNIRSQKAIVKIGAEFSHEEDLKISPTMDCWYCYSIDKAKWQSLRR